MIDLARLRKDPETVIALLEKKEPSCQARRLYTLDEQVRQLRLEVEELRHKKNELANQAKGGINAASTASADCCAHRAAAACCSSNTSSASKSFILDVKLIPAVLSVLI